MADPAVAGLPDSTQIGLRLRALIWSCLDCDLIRSAVFFGERYYSLNTHDHTAKHLYANILLRAGQVHSALHIVPDPSCMSCVEVYARCCNALGRFRLGYHALERCLAQNGGVSLDAQQYEERRQSPDAAVLATRLGLMAMKGNLPKEAIAQFTRALTLNPFIWEAFEGLCQLGSFPDVDDIMPPRGSYAVDTDHSPVSPKKRNGGGFFTPEAAPPSGRASNRLHDQLLGRGIPFKLGVVGPRESLSSLDSSFQESPSTQRYSSSSGMMLTNSHAPLLARTLPLPQHIPPSPDGRPASKRARAAGQNGVRMAEGTLSDTSRTSSSKTLVPASNKRSTRAGALNDGAPMRRSSRQAGKTTSTAPVKRSTKRTAIVAPPPVTSDVDDSMSIDPPQRPVSSHSANLDDGWDSNPTFERPAPPPEFSTEEADAYILELLRICAKSLQALARFRCQDAIDELERLPVEQQDSPWVMALTARACFEKLDYVKAERCYQRVRDLDPFRTWDMEIYSTLLWHLRRDTSLSFLSQELLSIDNSSTIAWIATGNCFSLQKEHTQALTCFKRAVQLDGRCAYALNLCGQESIALEEHDTAIDYFRQALQVDARHYQAWYGLGMVYFRTNKFDLAQYHYRKAIAINSANAVLICCDGMCHEQKGNKQAALEVYNQARNVAPSSSLAEFRRARMLAALGHLDAALEALLRLRDIVPDEANIPFMIGQIYRRQGKMAESAQAMAAALDVEPKLASAIRSATAMAAIAAGEDPSVAMSTPIAIEGAPPLTANQSMDAEGS